MTASDIVCYTLQRCEMFKNTSRIKEYLTLGKCHQCLFFPSWFNKNQYYIYKLDRQLIDVCVKSHNIKSVSMQTIVATLQNCSRGMNHEGIVKLVMSTPRSLQPNLNFSLNSCLLTHTAKEQQRICLHSLVLRL